MADKVFDRLDPNLLLKCYSKVTKSDKIHQHFNKMKFEKKEDRILIYQIYVSVMLPKCMEEKGHKGLKEWLGTNGSSLKTFWGKLQLQKTINSNSRLDD
jgi:hypothetical protein